MILVLLGTHPAPMDALVRSLDGLIDAAIVTEEVLIQSAQLGYRPTRARTVDVLPWARMQELIREATVVISHAGPATLSDVRAAGKAPVVIPRSPARGEHVDDHQIRYASRLRGQPGYVVPEGLLDLGSAIEEARATSASPRAADVSRAVAALEAIATSRTCGGAAGRSS